MSSDIINMRNDLVFLVCAMYACFGMAFITTPINSISSRLRSSRSSLNMAVSSDMMAMEELNEYAKLCNISLKISSTGPSLKVEAFDSNDLLIGYLTAFIRPIPYKLLHLDTIQVKNRRQTLGFQREGWTIDGPGISFIIGSIALRWGYDNGCRRTELLAVKDSDKMHKILIRLYNSFGFNVVKEVGDDFTSVSDRLVWGAVGTIMSMELEPFFKEWSPKLRLFTELAKRKVSS